MGLHQLYKTMDMEKKRNSCKNKDINQIELIVINLLTVIGQSEINIV